MAPVFSQNIMNYVRAFVSYAVCIWTGSRLTLHSFLCVLFKTLTFQIGSPVPSTRYTQILLLLRWNLGALCRMMQRERKIPVEDLLWMPPAPGKAWDMGCVSFSAVLCLSFPHLFLLFSCFCFLQMIKTPVLFSKGVIKDHEHQKAKILGITLEHAHWPSALSFSWLELGNKCSCSEVSLCLSPFL